MHELLLLNPHAFAVAFLNYAQLHVGFLIARSLYRSHFQDERKDAIRHHFWNRHATDIQDCREQKCAML